MTAAVEASSDADSGSASRWTVVVPVASFALAVSDSTGDEVRRSTLRDMAGHVLDVVATSDRVSQVCVVTGDQLVAATARRRLIPVVDDRPLFSLDPINEAIGRGVAWARVVAPTAPTAVVPADLPLLTRDALDSTLEAAEHLLRSRERLFVPDRAGRGTTLLIARTPDLLTSRYGRGSARAHSAAGYVPLVSALREVATDHDLRAGAHTT